MLRWIRTILVGALLTASMTLTGCQEGNGPAAVATDPLLNADSIFIRITVSQLPATLTFNQSHVPANRIEYWWGILFNTDGDAATGFAGYDIEIALAHANVGAPFDASPVAGAWHQLIEWTDSGGVLRGRVRHQDVAARIDAADGNTLILAVPRSWTEVARIETHDSVMVRTMYASPKPPLTIDQTSAGVGSQLLTDPVGDVPHGWIDILSGGWSTRLAVVMMDLRAVVVPSDGERGRDRRAPAPRQWSNGAWQP